jgi:DNA-binding protein YbaB
MSENMFDQVQQMHTRLQTVSDDLDKLKVRAHTEDRSIKITISGNLRLTRLVIDHEAYGDDPAVLDQALQELINDTISRVQGQVAERLGAVTGGFDGLDTN